MKSAVISGANGFIGNSLCRELLRQGYKVYGISRYGTTIKNEMYKDIIFNEELSKMINLFQVNEEYDYFFHFAWSGVSSEFQQSYLTQIKNIETSCQYVEFASRLKCKKFIFAGSIFEYENIQNRNITFDTSNSAKNYSYAKLAAHQMCLTLCNEKNMLFNSCLISNVFGENENSKRFISSFIKAIQNDEKFLLSQCDQMYDFIYIEDAINAIICIAEKGHNLCEYYIGYGDVRPLLEFVLMIRNLINENYLLEIGKRTEKTTYFDFNQFDVSKIKDDLDVKYKYDIVSALKKTVGGKQDER
ncbi:NAD-dependent epimerase/dehydratase family protein [Anaerorhabdus furcosa]|uniref:Nucleoside-diphosphate-sugar epimerase n=1 Tax=Anaerorhabdus furcosa TaxID=118967 RepID=A0A1T4LT50_9FIRM|nr:NAD(P)-dependent oxidoreductase [Anaerorhabdus furcosa]SJZ57919.1 Nucleoside-diphosphate-sugar epimerase [Anaerorhabdus furcosa]